MPIDTILEGLNPEQIDAVTSTQGPMLIIAGAGTGKTKVITSRIAYLISKKLAQPEEILALTFTEKACEEMQTRIDTMLPYGQSSVDIFTFHAFGDTILRENAIAIGLTPEYTLLNTAESIYFFKEHLFSFPLRYYRPISSPTKFIEALLGYFSKLKDEDIDVDAYEQYVKKLQDTYAKSDIHSEEGQLLAEQVMMQEELIETYRKFEHLKKEQGLVDFADLISLSLNMLRTHTTIRTYYQQKYRYILVDEYQDTNYAQNEIVKLLAAGHQNLCVCGDDDQSIYKFRGASISNILHFEQTYPTAKKVVLIKNYRSGQLILDKAYQLISHNNPDRLEIVAGVNKKLVSPSTTNTAVVEAKQFETLADQLVGVSQTIMQLHTSSGLGYADFAILLRSNSQVQPVIRELQTNSIPFKFLGSTGLYETEHIRLLLSYLFSVSRFDDNINLFHLASSSLYAISMDTLLACNTLARNENKPLFSILKKIDTYTDQIELSESDLHSCVQLVEDLEEARELSREQNVGSLLLTFIKKKNYLETISAQGDTTGIENVQKFFQRIDRFVTHTNFTQVFQFCDYIDYTREVGDDPAAAEADVGYDAVNILTIHKAKGMEFDTVFMIDLVDTKFPTREMRDPIEIPDALVREILPKGNFHKQEERRLFYVGMTRAKQRLYLYWAKDYYTKTLRKVSPYVIETGEAIKESPLSETPEEKKKKQPLIKIKKKALKKSQRILHLSASQIEEYLTCPLKYHYQYNLKLAPKENFATAIGSLMHMLTQQILEKKELQKNDVLDMITDLWRERGFLSQGHIDNALQQVKDAACAFLTQKAHFHPIDLEKKFSVTIYPDCILEGRWDMLEKNDRIVDFKTSAINTEEEGLAKAKQSIQLALYAYAYEKAYGKLPQKVSLYFLFAGIEAGYAPTQKTLQEAQKYIDQVYQGIVSEDFAAQPSFMACTYCPFNKICPFTLSH